MQNLNRTTTHQLGQNSKSVLGQRGALLQDRSQTLIDTTGRSPVHRPLGTQTKRNDEASYAEDGAIFKSQHASLNHLRPRALDTPGAVDHGTSPISRVGGRGSQNKFNFPRGAGNYSFVGGAGEGRKTTPFYQLQVSKANKTRTLQKVEQTFERDTPSLYRADRQQSPWEPQTPQLGDKLGFAHEEASTSKPGIFQAERVNRNPTFTKMPGQEERVFQPDFDAQASVMSFGRNIKPSDEPSRQRLSKFVQADVKDAARSVEAKLSAQMEVAESRTVNDYANQTGGLYPQYMPLEFQPSADKPLPYGIQQALSRHNEEEDAPKVVTEISKRHSVAYFGIGSKLFVWDFSHAQGGTQRSQLDSSALGGSKYAKQESRVLDLVDSYNCKETIVHITELNSVNRLSKWHIAARATREERFVLVATISEIKLLSVSKDSSQNKLVIQTTILDDLAQSFTAQPTEHEKTGRVFFARPGGRISELTFENREGSDKLTDRVANFFSERKRLYSLEHQKDSAIVRLMPSFFQTVAQRERLILQLRVDEQRNLLYSLAVSDPRRAQQQNIVEVIDLGFFGDEFRHTTTIEGWELIREIDRWLGKPALIKAEQVEKAAMLRITDLVPLQYAESQDLHLMLMTQQGTRIFVRLVTEVRTVETETAETDRRTESLGLQSDYFIMERVVEGAWDIVSVVHDLPDPDFLLSNRDMANKVMQGFFCEHAMPQHKHRNFVGAQELQMVKYDNCSSLMIYEMSQGQVDSEGLKVGIISKNGPLYAQLRQLGTSQNINEAFSLLCLQEPGNRPGGHLDLAPESLLQISNTKENTQGGKLSHLIATGFFKPAKDFPTWGDHSYVLPYFPWSDVERQVYLSSSKLSLLTSKRVVTVTRMRPIDKLYNILVSIEQAGKAQVGRYDDFIDFASTYTMEEACSMLIQICAETQASYLVSERLERLLNFKQVQANRANRRPYQHGDYLSQSAMRSASAHRSMTAQRLGGGASKQATQLSSSRFAGGRQSQSRLFMSGRDSRSQQRMSHLNQPDGLAAEVREDLTETLNSFDPSNESVLHERPINRRMIQTARDLLQMYGDTVGVSQRDSLMQCVDSGRTPSEHQELAKTLGLYSNKHKALYMYVQRVLKPIWKMPITSYHQVSRLDRQQFNLDVMMPVLDKLLNLMHLIEAHQQDFEGLTCKNQRLIGPDSPLYESLLSVNVLEPVEQEYIQVAEKQSLAQLRAFLQRCVDVIEFLLFIREEVDRQRQDFGVLIRSLDKNLQNVLSKQIYCDLVVYESNEIVRKLVEKTIAMQATEDAKMTEETLRLKQREVSERCPTLFSPLESKHFFAQSLIKNSEVESDKKRKDELVAKALAILFEDPQLIEIDTLVPSMIRNQQFAQIVRLCLSKLSYVLRLEDQTDEAADILDLIVQVVDSLDRAVTSSREEPLYSEAYAADLDRAVRRMGDLNLKLATRETLVSILANSQVQEGVAHLFRTFLFKGRDLEFIRVKVLPDLVEQQCALFVNKQSKDGDLTYQQFESVIQVLRKAQRPDELLSLVKDLLIERIALVEWRQIGSAIGDTERVPRRLTCTERLKLTTDTLQLVEHCVQTGRSGFVQDGHDDQVTGAIGSKIEKRQRLTKEVKQIQASLIAQKATLDSILAKIKLLEGYQPPESLNNEQRQQERLIRQEKLERLRDLHEQVEFALLGTHDLKAVYEEHALNDRRLILSFNLVPQNESQEKRLAQLQKETLRDLVSEIDTYCRDQRKFEAEFERLMRTIFTRQVIDQKKGLLMLASDLTLHRVDVVPENLTKGDHIWIQDFLLHTMEILPSELARHYLSQRHDDQPLYFMLSLALVQNWSQILTKSDKPDLKQAAYRDLCTHGVSIYQDLVDKFCAQYVSNREEMLKLQPAQANALRKLFEKANKSFASTLLQNISTFHHSLVVRLQEIPRDLAQPMTQPLAARPLEKGPVVLSMSSRSQRDSQQKADNQSEAQASAQPLSKTVYQSRNELEKSHRANRTFTARGSVTRQSQPNQQQPISLVTSITPAARDLSQQRPAAADQGCQLLLGDNESRSSVDQLPVGGGRLASMRRERSAASRK